MAKEETAPQEQPVVTCTVEEVAAMIQIIDICSKRGSFEGSEMATVGAVRSALLTKIKPAAAGEPAAE